MRMQTREDFLNVQNLFIGVSRISLPSLWGRGKGEGPVGQSVNRSVGQLASRSVGQL